MEPTGCVYSFRAALAQINIGKRVQPILNEGTLKLITLEAQPPAAQHVQRVMEVHIDGRLLARWDLVDLHRLDLNTYEFARRFYSFSVEKFIQVQLPLPDEFSVIRHDFGSDLELDRKDIKIIRLHFQTSEGFHTTVNFLKIAGLSHTPNSGVSSKKSPFPRERTQSAIDIPNPTASRYHPVMGPPGRPLSRSHISPAPGLRRATATGYQAHHLSGSRSQGYVVGMGTSTSTSYGDPDLPGSQSRIRDQGSGYGNPAHAQQPYARPATSQQYRDDYVPPSSFDPKHRFDNEYAYPLTTFSVPNLQRRSASQVQQNIFEQRTAQNDVDDTASAYHFAIRQGHDGQDATMNLPEFQQSNMESLMPRSSVVVRDSSLSSLQPEWLPPTGPVTAARMPSLEDDVMPLPRNVFKDPEPPRELFRAADVASNDGPAQRSLGGLVNGPPVIRPPSMPGPLLGSRPASGSRPPSRLASGLDLDGTQLRAPLLEVTNLGNIEATEPRNGRSSALGTTKTAELPTRRKNSVFRSNSRSGIKKPQKADSKGPVRGMRKAKTLANLDSQAQISIDQAAANDGHQSQDIQQSGHTEDCSLELAAASCTRCRRKHIGCNRLTPVCGSCTKARSICIYLSGTQEPNRASPTELDAQTTVQPPMSRASVPAVAMNNERQRRPGKEPVAEPVAERDTATEVEVQVRRNSVNMVNAETCTDIDYTTISTQTDKAEGLQITFPQWQNLMAAASELRTRRIEEVIRDTGSSDIRHQGPLVVRRFMELKEELLAMYRDAAENAGSHDRI